MMYPERAEKLNDELWDLKAKSLDVQDIKAAIILSRLCSIVQEILIYIPKENDND